MEEHSPQLDRVTDLLYGSDPWTWAQAAEAAGEDVQALEAVLDRLMEFLADEQMPESAREEAQTWHDRLTRRYRSLIEAGESELP